MIGVFLVRKSRVESGADTVQSGAAVGNVELPQLQPLAELGQMGVIDAFADGAGDLGQLGRSVRPGLTRGARSRSMIIEPICWRYQASVSALENVMKSYPIRPASSATWQFSRNSA